MTTRTLALVTALALLAFVAIMAQPPLPPPKLPPDAPGGGHPLELAEAP